MATPMNKLGSHLPTLKKAIKQTNGPILEMGVGPNSTPYLHYVSDEYHRHVISYEVKPEYYELSKGYQSKWHDIKLSDSYNDANIGKQWNGIWGVVLIDHAPAERRIVDIMRVKDNAIMIICHDSEMESDWLYRYSEIYPLFKYRFDTNDHPVQTTVLSMFKEFRP
ncbi:MAG TPA: hypothetical protein ENH60_03605 [Pricia sp.]|nr:hypothetical protein [Pricia sp.]